MDERAVRREFHKLYYGSGVWTRTTWLGIKTLKCPLDLWAYQEIVSAVRPDVIVETGTAYGGSALFLASVMDILGNGSIVSVDIKAQSDLPVHPRIQYVAGSSTDPVIVERVRKAVGNIETVLVILDSDHHGDHVARELQAYAPIVTPGSYLIVEDTNLNGNPVAPNFGEGPWEAVRAFLKSHKEFEADPSMEKFLLTFNPGGFLKRVDTSRSRPKVETARRAPTG
jgi:cephalosporin hydroxylase